MKLTASPLGVTVMPQEMVPDGLALSGHDAGLPALPDTEIVLSRAPGPLPVPRPLPSARA